MSADFGRMLPEIRIRPPGPESRRLAEELARYESPNVTFLSDRFPVFWREALGANVRDVDGNVYVDLTAAFAVAAGGHGHPAIVEAIVEQARRLVHGMGDVHPPAIKVDLLKRLAEIAPGDLCRSILASSGAEAVEAALKTMVMVTGKPKVISFHGAYHGLTLGALAVSGRDDFRAPFVGQLANTAVFVPYPRRGADDAESSLRVIEGILDGPEGNAIGGILAEPIQGRGGDIIPPDGWLAGLRRICDQRGILLLLDEIYTGFGRTGRWFACDHSGVVPDLLVVGKALSGGMPFAACIGTDAVMSAWPRSRGEALHTSTFLGHPLGCAAALASIDVIAREGWVERARSEGAYLLERLRTSVGPLGCVREVRGLGMMIGIELVRGPGGEPDPALAGRVVLSALQAGVLILSGGVASNVLSLSPPLNIERGQLDAALAVIEGLLIEEDRELDS